MSDHIFIRYKVDDCLTSNHHHLEGKRADKQNVKPQGRKKKNVMHGLKRKNISIEKQKILFTTHKLGNFSIIKMTSTLE